MCPPPYLFYNFAKESFHLFSDYVSFTVTALGLSVDQRKLETHWKSQPIRIFSQDCKVWQYQLSGFHGRDPELDSFFCQKSISSKEIIVLCDFVSLPWKLDNPYYHNEGFKSGLQHIKHTKSKLESRLYFQRYLNQTTYINAFVKL